jgi:pilus assembly protein CpaB
VCARGAAGVAAWHLRRVERRLENRFAMTTVLVAKNYIPRDTALAKSMVEERRVPDAFRAPTAMGAWAETGGEAHPPKARYEILAGEQICRSRIYHGENADGLAWSLEPGQRAVTVRLSREDAVGGFVNPGDRVDVFAVPPTGADATVILAAAPVIAVDNRGVETHGFSGEQGLNTVDGESRLITLAVARAETPRLVRATARDRIILGLRPPADATGSAGGSP